MHEGHPDVEETRKSSMPSFERRGILCGMAALEAHAMFGFRKHALVVDQGVQAPQRRHSPRKPANMPPVLRAALAKAPRARRLARTLEWSALGRHRHWKYDRTRKARPTR